MTVSFTLDTAVAVTINVKSTTSLGRSIVIVKKQMKVSEQVAALTYYIGSASRLLF